MTKTLKKSNCLFCSLGCGVAFRAEGESLTALDYDKDNPVNHGSLCPRGHYNFELANHPARLTEPQIGERIVSWEEALIFARHELKLFNKEEIGLAISTLASDEEALAAVALAKKLGVGNFAPAGYPPDLEAFAAESWKVPGAKEATLDEIENAETLLIVGDLLTRSPVLSRRVNKVKYGKRGNKIIVISSEKDHTSWFATDHLSVKPGTEAVALAALTGVLGGAGLPLAEAVEKTGLTKEQMERAAKDLAAAASGAVIFVPSRRVVRNDLALFFSRQLAAAAKKTSAVFYLAGNNYGVVATLSQSGGISYSALVGKIESGALKALILLGDDLSAGGAPLEKKLRQLKFVVRSAYFKNNSPLNADNNVVLPLASALEAGGSFTLAPERKLILAPVAPRVGSKTNSEIAALLAEEELAATSAGNSLVSVPVDLKEKLQALSPISELEDPPVEPITAWGGNRLVKNFFWYRVNNG